MSKENKVPRSFRLSPATIRELEQLAERYSISQSDVISILVHCHYMGFDENSLNKWFDMASRM